MYAKELLKEKGLTYEQFGRITGLSLNRVRQIVAPDANLTISTLRKIAGALGVPVWRLLVTPDEVKEWENSRTETQSVPDYVPRCPHCHKPLDIHVAKY